jgi:hypothetical protein
MECRIGCGACCIAPSIKSYIEGMPDGKPAGTKCIHLDKEYKCLLFNSNKRPLFCADFQAEELFCGTNRDEALTILEQIENDCK